MDNKLFAADSSGCTVEDLRRVLALLPDDCLIFHKAPHGLLVGTTMPLAAFPNIVAYKEDIKEFDLWIYALSDLLGAVQNQEENT